MRPLAGASISRWFTKSLAHIRRDAVEPVRKVLLATDPVGYAGYCAAFRDMDRRQFASPTSVQTLVIGDKADPSTPMRDSKWLVGAISSA